MSSLTLSPIPTSPPSTPPPASAPPPNPHPTPSTTALLPSYPAVCQHCWHSFVQRPLFISVQDGICVRGIKTLVCPTLQPVSQTLRQSCACRTVPVFVSVTDGGPFWSCQAVKIDRRASSIVQRVYSKHIHACTRTHE